jgi:hypothetical protein
MLLANLQGVAHESHQECTQAPEDALDDWHQ